MNGGIDLISITDNGKGMGFEDLPYAFCRHATSKIERFEDIYGLSSYGFRGEALASISSISRVSCSSIPGAVHRSGGKIEINGGEHKGHFELPNTGKQGTSIYIKDLFYNTPARLKFIKSKTAEKNSLKRIIHSFIISNPHVSFSIKWDDKEKLLYPAVGADRLDERLIKIFYNKKNTPETPFIEMKGEYDGYRVRAHVSRLSSKGNAGKHHYLFVNGRLFSDNTLHRAVVRTMEGQWHYGETGHYVFELEVPPNELDVNVHPSKTHIKFFKSSLVYSLLTSTIKEGIKKERQSIQANSSIQKPTEPQGTFFSSPIDQLKMMQEKNLSEQSYQHHQNILDSGQLLQDQNNSEAEVQICLKLNRTHSLLKIKSVEHFVLINRSMLIAQELSNLIRINTPITEDHIIPLLISEPFELGYEIDNHLEFLNSIGLEMDRLTPSTIVLRSIPEYLNDYIISDVVRAIISAVCKHKNSELDQFLKDFENCSNLGDALIVDTAIKDIVIKKGVADLLSNGALAMLTDEKINTLFKGKQ